jgi:2'-5' RNA ligase
MADTYFIEYRFVGKSKQEIRKLVSHVNRKFHLKNNKKIYPHITLFGSFSTFNERKLIHDFNYICSQHSKLKFKIDGYDAFANSKVVYLKIIPNKNLSDFRFDLANELSKHCKSVHGKKEISKDFKFHATIALKINDSIFEQIKEYTNKLHNRYEEHEIIRITLLKNGKILREYDFKLKRPLTRPKALSKGIRTTESEIVEKLDKSYLGIIDVLKNFLYQIK